jgi:putative transposase
MWAANMDRITQTRAREVADQITEECPEARTFVLDSDGSEDGYEYVSRVFDDDGNELDVDTAVFDAFPPDEAQQMEHLGQEVVSDYDSTTGQLTYRPLADGERLPLHERYKLTRRYSIDLGFGPREHRRSGRWSGPPPLADTCIAKREPRPTGSSPAVSTAAHSPGIETPRTSNHQEEISMKKRYAFRAYPTGDQARALARLFGCCRLVYNRYIDRAREDHAAGIKYRGATAYQHEVLTRLKKHPDYTFLTEVSGVPLVQTVRDADQAYRNYFNSLTGKRKGRKMRRPRFRSRKDNRQAARFSTAAGFRTTQHEDRAWGAVRLPRVGQLRFRSSRMLPSAPTSITVIQKASGRWYVSFVVEVPTPEPLPANGRVAGIDLGLTDLATITTSDGVREKIVTPKHLRRQERKLARAQRELARRKKGSANRAKSRKKVARIHEKTAAQRLDHHHKLASRLVHENQVLGLETLSIRAMARTRLARSIHDAGWGTLIRLIEEKARERGRRVYRDPAFSPSTRTCSICGVIGEKKPLGVRVWECAHCGSVLDRDYNAACNLMVAAGHAETLNACGGDVRLRLAGADPAVMRSHAKQEPAELGSCCAA